MGKSSRKRLATLLTAAVLLAAPAMALAETAEKPQALTLTLIGHASMKIKTADGVVIYIDPYYSGDYSEKADIILVSHEHSDHNQIKLCKQNKGCLVVRAKNAINQKDLSYNTFEHMGVVIQPVPAANKNHSIKSSVGFLLTIGDIAIYHAGDTSKLEQMAALKERNIDYAFFPIDGVYNMDAAEAMECAAMVGAKHNTPMHYFDADPAAFTPENLLMIRYGETVELVKAQEETEEAAETE